jgi:hypothetical protein
MTVAPKLTFEKQSTNFSSNLISIDLSLQKKCLRNYNFGDYPPLQLPSTNALYLMLLPLSIFRVFFKYMFNPETGEWRHRQHQVSYIKYSE